MKLTDLKARVKAVLDKIVKGDSKLYALVGLKSIMEIKKRTRQGFGVPVAGGSKEKLAPLSDSYVMARKGAMSGKASFLAKGKPVSFQASTVKPLNTSYTSAGKSNLTNSGVMLDSLTYDATNMGVTVGFENQESEKKAEYAHKGSTNRPERKFLNLSDLEKKRIEKEVKEYLLSKVKDLI